MHLTPTERDRLLLFSAAGLARRPVAAGVLLNVPEAIALPPVDRAPLQQLYYL